MQINHLALVPEGRCGEEVRILDQKGKTLSNESDTNLVKKLLHVIKADKKRGGNSKKVAIRDVDMESLVRVLAEKLMPDVKKMLAS